MIIKKILCVFAAITLVFSAGGCAAARSSGVIKAPEKIRIVLDWTPNTNHTGMYVALEKGWYSEAGLEVELLQPPEDGALALVAAGNAQFGVDFQEWMGPALASDEAIPVEAVAAIISHNTSGIISLKESGISSPKGLEGKRYATWDLPLEQAVMREAVESDGGNFDEVELIPVYVEDIVSALQTNVDAVWIYYAWDGIAAELAGLDTNYFEFGDLNPVFDFYTPVIIANSDFIKSNPDAAKKFMAATAKGYEFAIENPDEAADILLKHAPELDEKLVKASQKYLAGQYKADASKWGEIDPARWDAFYGWMYENGLLEKDIRGKGFTNELLA